MTSTLKSEGGVIFIGEKGILLHDTYGSNPRLYPQSLSEAAAAVPKSMPRIAWSHELNWTKAIRGEAKASSPIEYAAQLTETMLLGLVALRAGQGKKILYDGETRTGHQYRRRKSIPDARVSRRMGHLNACEISSIPRRAAARGICVPRASYAQPGQARRGRLAARCSMAASLDGWRGWCHPASRGWHVVGERSLRRGSVDDLVIARRSAISSSSSNGK